MKNLARKITSSSLSLFALALSAHAGTGQFSIGLKFATDATGGLIGTRTLTALAPADVAGLPAVAQGNWNNLAGATGTGSALVDNSGNPTTATLTWNATGTWANGNNGANFLPGTPDNALQYTYLDIGSPATDTITVNNLPPDLTTKGYDVYIYTLGDTGGRGGAYGIFDPVTTGAIRPYQAFVEDAFPTNYVQCLNVGSGTNATGNYVVFHGLTNANINIQSTTTVNPQSGTPRAPICGIQIVSAPSPGEAGSATGLNMQTNGLSGQMTISWTPGSGSSGTLVLMRPNAPVTAEPVDGTNYTANTTFGLGSDLGDDEVGNHNIAVFNGSGNSVTVSNLTPNVRYWAAAYSFNAGPNYTLAAPASSNLVAQGVATNLIFLPPSPFIVGSASTFSVIAQYDNGTSVDVTPSATVISSNNAIVSVPSAGRLAANSLGTVGVRAIFQGNTNIQLVTVSALSMTHRYSFSEAAGTTNAVDSVSGGNGELVSSDASSSINGSGQLFLSGNGTGVGGATTNYMFLPADLFTNYGAVTIELWATENAEANWERIFDFGNSQAVNFFMTPEAGTVLYRTAMTTSGGGGEQRVNFVPSATLAGTGEHQFVFTLSGATHTAILYLDGTLVNINTNFTMIPSDLGHTAFDLIGGSQYPDPSWNGTIDEFRIYNGAVDPFQIVLDSITGPDAITSENAVGALNSMTVNVTTPLLQFSQSQITVTGVFANVTSPVPITFAPQTTYTSQNVSVFTVSPFGLITANGPGTANLIVTAFGKSVTNSITVTPLPPGMTHRWSFNGDYTDSLGGAAFAATNSGNAIISGNQVVLDGSGGNSQTAGATYVKLPNNLLLGYSSVAIEAWYTDAMGDDGTRNWARIWDFGTPGGGNNLFVTPYVAGERDTMRTSLNINNAGEWQVHNVRPLTNVEHQLVFVEDFSNRVAYVYVDGVQVGQNKSFQRQPTDLGQTVGDWIGRSQYGDPLFVGSVDELRIYNGTLDPVQIAIDAATGPDVINTNPGPVLSVSVGMNPNPVVGNILDAQLSAAYTGIANVPLSSGVATWTSSNPSVARVDQYGEVTAVSPGTATISATFQSVTGTTNITVSATSPTLQHRYSFTSDGTDSVSGSNATVNGTATIANGTVIIPDASAFVQFPGHLFDTNLEVTLEAWCVTSNSAGSGSRMMDFGTSPNTGGTITTAFGLSTKANGSDYLSLRPSPNTVGGVPSLNSRLGRPAIGVESHVAWVISDINQRVDFYLNGNLVDSFPYNTRPWETMGGNMQFANILGYQTNIQTEGWIGVNTGDGASGWIGNVDEFRIWNGALNPLQMKVSDLNGPNTASIDPGAAQSLTMTLSDTSMIVGALQHPSVSGTFANVTGSIDISAVPGVVLSSDNSAVVAVTGHGLGYGELRAVSTGTAHITASYGGQTSTKTVTVVAKPALVLTHDYLFNGNADDSVGTANGTVFGGVTFTSGGAVFDGTIHPASYIKLPSDLISGYDLATFEAFYTATSVGSQQRLWDFGDRVNANGGITGSGYIFDAPGIDTTSIPNGSPSPSAAVTVPGNLAVGYQAVTVDSVNHILTLYTNGVFAGSTTNPAITLANVVDNYSQLGLSQWADPALNGTIREFRLYYGVMTPGQVAASFSVGPSAGAPKLSITAGPGPGQVTVSWSAAATGYSLQMTTSLNSTSWVAAGTPTQVGNQEQVVVTVTPGTTTFFRLIK